MTESVHSPSLRARRFVSEYLVDGNGAGAAVRAGYGRRSAHVTASRLLRNAKVQALLAEARQGIEREFELNRERVLVELIEAINVAKQQGNPAAMIAGWREIAKICGYYKAERRQVQLSPAGRSIQRNIEQMTDAELAAMLSV